MKSSSTTRFFSSLGMAGLGGNPGASVSAAVVEAPVDFATSRAGTYTKYTTGCTILDYNLSDIAVCVAIVHVYLIEHD